MRAHSHSVGGSRLRTCFSLSLASAALAGLLATPAEPPEPFPPLSRLPSRPESPDPLVSFGGERITSPGRWRESRRPELKALFQFDMLRAANPVYRLLGAEGLASETRPEVGRLIDSRLGYFIREGEHSTTGEDWEIFVRFADRHFGRGRQ